MNPSSHWRSASQADHMLVATVNIRILQYFDRRSEQVGPSDLQSGLDDSLKPEREKNCASYVKLFNSSIELLASSNFSAFKQTCWFLKIIFISSSGQID